MLDFFLRLRHWELFLMLVLPSLLSYAFGLPFDAFLLACIGLFLMLVLFIWMFSIGYWANRLLPEQERKSAWPYALALLIPIIYALIYIIVIIPLMASSSAPTQPPLWLFPLHILSMAGVFYGLWFTASQFKSLQAMQRAELGIFSSVFFMLFIFPLGLWIIQPSVNQHYQQLGWGAGDDA